MNRHLYNEKQEYKTVHVKRRVTVGAGRVNEEGKGG
jgi:hypothetical protein